MHSARDALLDLYLAIPVEVFENLPRHIRHKVIFAVYQKPLKEDGFVSGYIEALQPKYQLQEGEAL